jgi:hypothetical protein
MRRLALIALVAIPMAFNAFALLPEVTIEVPEVNDDAEHVLFIQQASDGWASGEDPLEFWVPDVELGFPQFLYYQNLPHLFVVALGKLTFGLVPLRTLFDLTRYVLLVGFPLTVFWSMRRLGFSDVAAAIGAAAGSLLSSGRYGFEYDSYVWRGLGVYTQIFGMHLSFIAVATLHRVATRGSGVIPAALACAALALSHLIYAYMTAITAVVLLLFGLTRANAVGRVLRFGAVGALAGVIGAYMWVPFFAQAGYLNVSPYLDRAKYDSFGAPTVLGWLVSGDLLDHGRLPVLTALLAVGIAAALITRARLLILTLTLFVLWLVLYFGRPTLGPIADLLPLHEGLLFHRFIGGVDLFAILLIGSGGAYLWTLARAELSPRRLAAVATATAIVFVPVLAERWTYYAENATWMRITQAAIAADTDARTVLDALAAQPPGRVYAGMRTNWGRTLDFGIPFESARMYHLLTFDRFDALAPPYRGASINSDLLFDFNDQDAAQYRLFDVEYVIAPPSAPLVAGLAPIVSTPKYVLYRAPGGGYAEYAGVARTETPSSQLDLFERARAWLRGGAATSWQFARYGYLQRAPAEGSVPIGDCPRPGISYARAQSSQFDVLASCESDSAMVLKVTYHPNWHVTVDGSEVATFMVSPSYLAFALPAGQHFITAEYRSAPLKDPLFFLGVAAALGAIASGVRFQVRDPRRWRVRVPPLREPILLVRRFRDFVLANEPVAGPALAVALAACAFVVLAPFTPRIAFNDGLGFDGRVYAWLTQALRGDQSVTVVPPWSFRLAPSGIVALTGLEVKLGFLLLDLVSALGSAWLLYRLLRHYAVSPALTLLAVGWWAVLPLGLRWALYYPVLPDTLGFLLLLALMVAALERRYAVFAGLLIVAALTRENLIALGPFLWLAHIRRDPVGVTLRSLAVGVPAVLVYFAVRFVPVIPPPPDFTNWGERYQIGLNLRFVFENIDAHAWRYILAAPLTLGMFFALPFAWPRRVLAFLRREKHWAYYLVMTFAVALFGGRDDDRYLYVLVPALAVFVFHLAPSSLWLSAWRLSALTLLHLAAVRFLWPVGTSESQYLQYTVSAMSVDRMVALTIFCFVLGVGGIVVARLDLRALNPARATKAESSA